MTLGVSLHPYLDKGDTITIEPINDKHVLTFGAKSMRDVDVFLNLADLVHLKLILTAYLDKLDWDD